MTERTRGKRDDQTSPVREAWQVPANQLLALAIVAMTAALNGFFLRAGGWADAWGVSFVVKVPLVVLLDSFAVWCCLAVVFRPRQTFADFGVAPPGPTGPNAYLDCGLGPLPNDVDPKQLYLDQVKRAVCNILYEDPPFWFYDDKKQPVLASGFSLLRRVQGEDSPTTAHTMVGTKRLDNLQFCIEDVLTNNVPGDLIETGSYRGGATIFMRAVLKAHNVRDRRVFVCDTFVPPAPRRPSLLIMPFIQALAAIPIRTWQHKYFHFLQRLPQQHRAFPAVAAPSDDIVRFLLWNLLNPVGINHGDNTNLDVVKSNFARYGLLDDLVVFLQGFFADTLPKSPFEKLAIVRLDGDTYESTWDAIHALYPKLSPGGYLVVDDYRSFSDCQRAVEEYRTQHDIHDAIRPIDNMAVYWQRS